MLSAGATGFSDRPLDRCVLGALVVLVVLGLDFGVGLAVVGLDDGFDDRVADGRAVVGSDTPLAAADGLAEVRSAPQSR